MRVAQGSIGLIGGGREIDTHKEANNGVEKV